MIPLLLGLAAGAAELHLVAVDGEVHPGRPVRIEAVVLDDRGEVVAAASPTPTAGTARLERRAAPDGVISLLWTPPDAPGSVEWTVPGLDAVASVEVTPRPAPPWSAPRRIDGFDRAPVRLAIVGEDPPSEPDLGIFVSEPAEVAVGSTGEGSEVSVTPEGTGARVVLVALHDLRRDAVPQVVPVRIIDRPTLSFDLEVGARLRVLIGGRSYGPFVSDGSGPVRARIEQYPGERQAELVVSDELGNELVTPYVLSGRADPAMVVVTAGRPWPGELAPELLVAAARPDGRPWSGGRPSCRTPDLGEVDLVRVEAGLWRVVEPARETPGRDVRLDCRLGDTVVSHRVPAPTGLPVSLDLRVYPEELSTDFPVAEVTAHLLDIAGERLPADGIEVSADRGAVTLEPPSGGSRRGEYRGGVEAVREGSDSLQASLRLPTGEAPVAHVQLAHGALPREGTVRVHGRALDILGRPIPGASLRLSAGAASEAVVAGPDGWASAQLEPGAEARAVRLEARVGGRVVRAQRARGGLPWGGGPGLADLVARTAVRLTAGRVSTLRIDADTPVLYATPGARLSVRIYLYDRGENLVTDEVPVVTVDEGALGPPRLMPDGGYEVEYVPVADTRGGVVTLVARAPTGSASASFRLRLELRPVLAVFGPALGVISNFGRITSLAPSFDLDLRLPVLSNQLMLRLGISGYTTSRETSTVAGDNVKRLTVLPITLGVLVRQDRGAAAGWLGLGATVAPFQAVERFDEDRFPPRTGVLPPGFTALVGGARRIRGGEAFLEIRGTFLSSPGGDVGFTGQVGGLGAVLGYRLVID